MNRVNVGNIKRLLRIKNLVNQKELIYLQKKDRKISKILNLSINPKIIVQIAPINTKI